MITMSTPSNLAVTHGAPGNMQRFRDTVRNREEFTAGNVSGHSYAFYGFGYLPDEFKNAFAADANQIDYVVYSYRTPIAWHTTDGRWTIPAVRYSASTSRQQNAVRRALSIEDTDYRTEI
jgi:hypothetical protein